MSSIRFRVQDWLADRVSWMQYPQIQRLGPRRALFRHAMPWPTRMLLILVGTVMLVGCAIALFFLGLLAWATITA